MAWRYDGSELGGGDTVLVLYNAEPNTRPCGGYYRVRARPKSKR